MYTKSLIQQKLDNISIKNTFNETLTDIMNKYNIEDSIFVMTNNGTKELTSGYFVVEKEYSNIDDAINAFNIKSNGIRIVENKIFQVGSIYNNISQCPKDKQIFDVGSLEYVR